jgi:hypothetical protein
VHPVGTLFPMISDAELDDLAANSMANGQRQSIMRDFQSLPYPRVISSRDADRAMTCECSPAE